jgi:hypothetical protein
VEVVSSVYWDFAVDYEQDEIGSASIFYGLDSDSKAGTEPDYRQAGPLLGSCLSSPSSPTIVSRVNSMQWVLGDEVFQGHIDGGDDETKAPSCLVEDEMPSLAGLERESFGENSGLESPDSGTGRGQRKMVPEDTKGSAPLLGDGCDDQTYEVWWKRWAALWYMQARQANTIWSIALAATVMGLVIIGHRWQHERCQNQQLRLQLCSKDEKISQLVFQIARLKEALSGRRHVPVLRTRSSYSSFLDRV